LQYAYQEETDETLWLHYGIRSKMKLIKQREFCLRLYSCLQKLHMPSGYSGNAETKQVKQVRISL
jgi:hypothetical protein